jgi:NADH:ubiquinone reductase (H+-translocating)
MSEPQKRIVIVGGGFAGVYTAKYLCQALRRAQLTDIEVALVSRENYLVFQPLLPEVIAGTVQMLHTISPIRRIVPDAALHVRAVQEIDLAAGTLTLEPGYIPRRHQLKFDHLVVALGTRLAGASVPGLNDHGIPFKYLGDALRLRHHLVHVLEEAAITTNSDERRRLLTFVVAGGGFSGVECIAEMHDFLRHAVRSFPSIPSSDLQLILLQSAEAILPEMKPKLALFAHRILAGRGVDIRTQIRLTAVTAQTAITVHKQTGETLAIPTRTVVATVPVEPHPLLATLPCAKEKGKLLVNNYLHSPEWPNLWSIGDCAAVPMADGRFAPPTAQHAVRQAKRCAENIVARLTNRPLQPFSFQSLGSLASLGRRSAVAEVMGVSLSGFVAWIMWRAIYLTKFPGWDRKLRILSDWLMDLVLPRDITELRIFPPAAVRREHFVAGEVLFHQGDIGDRIYFVVSGEADVEVNGEVVATVGAESVIGEIALVKDTPRTATVRVKTELDAASVSSETFHTLVAHFPGVKEAMNEIMGRHLAADSIRDSALRSV